MEHDSMMGQWMHKLPSGSYIICTYMQWDDGVPVGGLEERWGADAETD